MYYIPTSFSDLDPVLDKDLDSDWIRIGPGFNQDLIRSVDPDTDPHLESGSRFRRAKLTPKIENSEEF